MSKTTKAPDKALLLANIAEARKALDLISIQERIAENTPLVGTFYKFRNSYSCPETPKDYWHLYIAVTGIDEYGHLKAWGVQKDKYGNVSVNTRDACALNGDCKQIPAEEFWSAYKSIIAALPAVQS